MVLISYKLKYTNNDSTSNTAHVIDVPHKPGSGTHAWHANWGHGTASEQVVGGALRNWLTYSGTMDVSIGDIIQGGVWYVVNLAWPLDAILEINGRKVAHQSQSSRSIGVWHTITASDLKKSGSGKPVYLEQLHKLNQKSTNVSYIPKH